MFDGKEDTCWNSDQVVLRCGEALVGSRADGCLAQGSEQVVTINFKRLVSAKELRIMFQGGFVGKVCMRGCACG